MIKLKRIYDAYDSTDGYRILVDRLWPRGISRQEAHLDLWLKEIAPSTKLRQWFGHDPNKWSEFEKRYQEELADKRALILQLQELEKKHQRITLLYGARDTKHNQAVVLLQILAKLTYDQ